MNTAKALLVSRFGDHVHPERKKNRRDSHHRTEKIKVCEDIVDALFDIDEHIDITCVSLKWTKTINVAPTEVPDLMLAEKVIEMEYRFKLFEDALSELKTKQMVLEEQQGKPLMSQVVAGVAKPPQLDIFVNRDIESTSRGLGHQIQQGGLLSLTDRGPL